MEPQKSIIIPVTLAVLISAVIFGAGGYYLANSQNTNDTTSVTPTQTTTAATQTAVTPSVVATVTTTTDITADWKLWTRTEQQSEKFTIKTPKEWKVLGSDSGGGSLVLVYDETHKTNDLTDDDRVFFQFSKAGSGEMKKSYDDFKKQSDDGAPPPTVTGAKKTTLAGYAADYQVENGTTAAYYIKWTDSVYIKVGYSLSDKQKDVVEAVVQSFNLSPTTSSLGSATQIP